MSKTLYLSLKKEWYNMIESGVKTEEYREFNPYWIRRLTTIPFKAELLCSLTKDELIDVVKYNAFLKRFEKVRFSYGYTRRTMTFECKGLEWKTGKPEWGAEPGEICFVITLGKRLK